MEEEMRKHSQAHAPIIQLMQAQVTQEVNHSLCAEFSDQEISDAVF
jgi:hypothetical protein